MASKFEIAQDKLLGRIGKLCSSFGLNGLLAQLYTILYLSEKPLSLDEMAEKLKISKGSVSINIRELEKWGAVKNLWVKGSRKDYYEANLDVKQVILNKVKSGVQRRMTEVEKMLDEFKDIVQSSSGELTEEEKNILKVYEERIKKIEDLKNLGRGAMNLAEKLF